MKRMKKLAALFLAIVMVMAMGMTAFANPGDAATCSIQIKGAINGATYTAYKIFDVTPNDNGKASYTRPAADEKVKGSLDENKDLFIRVDNGGDNVYYNPVSGDDGFADNYASDLEAYLKTAVEQEKYLESKVSEAAANDTATISNLTPGYYYVVNNYTGLAAMLRAVAGAEPTVIIEKDIKPGWGDGGGKKAYNDVSMNNVDNIYAIGDTVYYKVEYNGAYNYSTTTSGNDVITEKVHQYIAVDTMDDGLRLDDQSIKVYVNDNIITNYTVDTTNGLKITIPWAESEDAETVNDFIYDTVPSKIKITYKAEVMGEVNGGEALTNEASIFPNQVTAKTPDNTSTVKVYTGYVVIQKYDSNAASFDVATDDQKLPGAEFKIYRKDANDGVEYLKQDATSKAISWGTEGDATTFKTGADGTVTVNGLDAGTYYIKETVAPAGYNALETTDDTEDLRKFEIKSFTVPADQEPTEAQLLGLTVDKEVANSTGAVLPSTGGIGTTIFYVVGGILVLGAGVLLITKKRMSAK